ncbi:hypothetical protein [Kutzneria chonburiensis]|uniref:DUF4232 domain-containing protein n=1 Tax=Kutzneria chonburiensis TaxID=1483604 RepID=A0ABV6MLI8_9PSEU|nr:hypothetical protein [Kutzneria chonburiensis]
MELPPYREMPPEVRLRLRARVLPAFSPRPSHRGAYLVAAALIATACVTTALLLSPARTPAPVASPSVSPSSAPALAAGLRLSTYCPDHGSGSWVTGPYLPRPDGGGVQLALETRSNTLGLCVITGGHGTWSSTTWQSIGPTSYTAFHDLGLAYGVTASNVASVTVDNAPAAFDTGMFLAEASGPFTLIARDAQGRIVGQGTVN